MISPLPRAFLSGLVFLAPWSPAQDPPASQPTRDQMWWPPTAEDWKKPVLVTWQRTWDDAVAVSRETGKPILLCVNMDGEPASEHYAGVRYRQPEIAKLYEPFVTVMASVYRHNPRDHDEQGRRILCPRFGGVTCGEHIAIEPLLFDKYFDGQRVAPRHILLDEGHQESFDIYYALDTDSVFKAIKDGALGLPAPKPRGDRTLEERASSCETADRAEVEAAFLAGDLQVRRTLLTKALQRGDPPPVDLLRLALAGFDVELNQMARKALSEHATPGAVDLIADALRVPMAAAEREGLLGALERLAAVSPKARTFASVFRGLGARAAIDVEGWTRALAKADTSSLVRDTYALESRLTHNAHAAASRPVDAQARLELAESALAFAVNQREKAAPRHSTLLFEDVLRAAHDAERLGVRGWRVDTTIALASWYLGRMDEARTRAEAAFRTMPPDAQSWNAMAVLALFAQQRHMAIAKAAREKTPWPPQWLTDVNAAYSVLAQHPFGTDQHIADHHDLIKALGAAGPASRILDAGLVRFPESWALHDRLRTRVLEEKGIEGLEPTYDALLAERRDAAPNLEWFAGYAALVTAEFHQKRGRTEQALAAYSRAIARYEAASRANPASRDSSDHYVALALAGRSRIAQEREEWESAVDLVLESFRRKPEAAASEDGLGRSPVATAQVLAGRLTTLKRPELVAKVQAGLDALDPKFLLPPASEALGPSPQSRPRRRGPGR
jgi:tetratricopeptide (TPR) repeat protein